MLNFSITVFDYSKQQKSSCLQTQTAGEEQGNENSDELLSHEACEANLQHVRHFCLLANRIDLQH